MMVLEQLDKINRQLRSSNYKLTPQREATVRVLLENEQEHLSAEDVYMLVKDKYPDIGLATVYRTLELLAELHIVEKMNFGDGVARFDLRSEEHTHMHHHLICTVCGALKEIKDDWLLELENRLQQEYGFKVTDHRLDFMGTYHTCKSSECKRASKAIS
ncbi:Fur family transcriptional regulator [Paenibacillus validus]|uniref:ferric iron uptake transcriptional regulator n=1 Tax=Paenibacillus TaxID=44249 RepID=UPI0006D087F8|nr:MULTISPECIES: Fur family transcriptional regulator [Paenibacillus]MED4600829.1 Fur family transcriptional regulator [Paenibacillus validus]MED4606601.1 Fur family transcriptional regulator [Paenibacillus validus]